MTLRTVFFFLGQLQKWSKSVCLTFVHNIWPLEYSVLQLINNATSTHVFPFTMQSKGTHHPACHYPALSTTMNSFSVLFTHIQSGREWAFDHKHDQMWSAPSIAGALFSKISHPSLPLNSSHLLERCEDLSIRKGQLYKLVLLFQIIDNKRG